MKKTVVILLVFTMLFSMAACGSGQASAEKCHIMRNAAAESLQLGTICLSLRPGWTIIGEENAGE